MHVSWNPVSRANTQLLRQVASELLRAQNVDEVESGAFWGVEESLKERLVFSALFNWSALSFFVNKFEYFFSCSGLIADL